MSGSVTTLADHLLGGNGMTAQPAEPGSDTGSYELIHLGGQAAVVVPVARLPAPARPGAGRFSPRTRGRRGHRGGAGVEGPGRRRPDDVSCPRTRHGAGSAYTGEAAGRLRRTSDQPGGPAFLDDPQGMREVLDAIDQLADDPRPAGSFPYGSPDLRRLRVGPVPGSIRDHRRRGGDPAYRPRRRRELTGEQAWDFTGDRRAG
jgi:hypothetical protein